MLNYKIKVTPQQVLAVEGSGGALKESQETKKYSVERENLQKKLDELNEKAEKLYAAAAEGGDYGLKRLEYDKTTDDEIYNLAKRGLNEKYTLKSEALAEETEQNKQSLEQKKQQISEQTSAANANIAGRYEAAKEQAGEDAIKRGIARSSIISEMLKEYDKQKLSAIDDVNAEAREKIAAIDDEIAGLSQKLNSSLKQFDMEKAIELNEKIDALKAARDEKNTETLKYNNEVSETLLKYADALKETVADKYKKQGDSYKTDMAVAILDYYSKLTPEEALKDFESSDYTKYLSAAGLKMVTNYLNLRNAK